MASMLATKENSPGLYDWQYEAHNKAVAHPEGIEVGLIRMIDGWARYAPEHRKLCDDLPIGLDGYAAEYWEDIGRALRKLLANVSGPRLNMGTLDFFLLQTAKENSANLED